ncbi:helix-turn-helix transcriptional regulator [Prosthecomicrobium sp. N25]|uniref:helix-turn-helix transcriptional regulator n=1 Tax=Prosthecomicrobium sp. N25 TaxID=3129254 RepID=UPI0030781449
MLELDVVEELSDAIVLAGLEPDAWGRIPDLITAAFPGAFTGVIGDDSRAAAPIGLHAAGLDESFLESFTAYYAAINPWIRFWEEAPCFEALTADATYPARLFAATEFYNDWLLPTGRTSGAGIKLLQSPDAIARLYVNYPGDLAPVYDPALTRIINALRPALRAAIAMNRHVAGPSGVVGGALGDILDACPVPGVVVDQAGTVLLANAAGAALLARDGPLTEARGRLAVRGAWATDRMLAAAIRDAAQRTGQAGAALPVRDEDGRLRGTVTAVPLGSRPPDGAAWLFGPARRVLVMMRGFLRLDETVRRRLSEDFGLTRAECEVTLRLAAGASALEVSAALGIAHETTRRHLKHVFEKTGCRRQAELVALVLLMT